MPVFAEMKRDSVSPRGDRLFTVVGELWRPMLPENNTHRGLTKNSASSRAIPIEKQLARIASDVAMPLYYGSEIKGMQSGPELTGEDLRDAQDLVMDIYTSTTELIEAYLKVHPLSAGPRLHKSLLSRYLEPFMWHTLIQSGTEEMWMNFFRLRSTHFTTKAQPEMAAYADAVYEAWCNSTPAEVGYGEWHLPYIDADDDFSRFTYADGPTEAAKMVSTGRLCRVSYLTQDGRRDMSEDIRLFSRLATERPIHASPLEHIATPTHPDDRDPHRGNFKGWVQYRHLVEDEIEELGNITADEYVQLKLGGVI